ncbi:MAG: ABC transporter substrate-binding protein [Methermicoccaceae archaeon]
MKILWVVVAVVALIGAIGVFSSGCVEETESKTSLYIVTMSPSTMLEELSSGDIDGFIAWEPFPAEAVVSGDARYLVQSGEIWPNHPCCVVAVSKSYTDKDVITALVWAHIKATEFINDPENHDKVVQYAMDFTGKNEEVASLAMQNIKYVEYPNETQFRVYYEKLKEGHLLKNDLSELGYSSEDDFFSDFLNPEYYEQVVNNLKENPEWVPDKVDVGETVRLGYLSADLHQLATYVALKEGYYEDAGLIEGENLIIMPPYVNGPAVMEAFKNGELDVSYLGGAPATLKRINDNTSIQVVAGVNNEGSAIVVPVNSDIKSIDDIGGHTIATPGIGTVQDFIVRDVASNEGLSIVLK